MNLREMSHKDVASLSVDSIYDYLNAYDDINEAVIRDVVEVAECAADMVSQGESIGPDKPGAQPIGVRAYQYVTGEDSAVLTQHNPTWSTFCDCSQIFMVVFSLAWRGEVPPLYTKMREQHMRDVVRDSFLNFAVVMREYVELPEEENEGYQNNEESAHNS